MLEVELLPSCCIICIHKICLGHFFCILVWYDLLLFLWKMVVVVTMVVECNCSVTVVRKKGQQGSQWCLHIWASKKGCSLYDLTDKDSWNFLPKDLERSRTWECEVQYRINKNVFSWHRFQHSCDNCKVGSFTVMPYDLRHL